MPETILFYSSRHGVGRSNITANLAYLLAAQGQRVGIIDTDTKSPITHSLFSLKEAEITYAFNDYLNGRCQIEQAAYDISAHLPVSLKGHIFLVPANTDIPQTAHELSDTQDAELLNSGCRRLIETLELDTLLVDTQPGISKKSLIALTISDTLVIILRLDQQDYQETSVAVDIVHQLDIPRVMLIVNETPQSYKTSVVKAEVEKVYNCEVAAVLPYVEEIMSLANRDIFAMRYPHHPVTALLKELTAKITG